MHLATDRECQGVAATNTVRTLQVYVGFVLQSEHHCLRPCLLLQR